MELHLPVNMFFHQLHSLVNLFFPRRLCFVKCHNAYACSWNHEGCTNYINTSIHPYAQNALNIHMHLLNYTNMNGERSNLDRNNAWCNTTMKEWSMTYILVTCITNVEKTNDGIKTNDQLNYFKTMFCPRLKLYLWVIMFLYIMWSTL